ncbi:MAG TPA: SCO family protein, partial [Myxococcaceae bacterium]|nr:SCO family protein [Myxococcaceae bacterium]
MSTPGESALRAPAHCEWRRGLLLTFALVGALSPRAAVAEERPGSPSQDINVIERLGEPVALDSTFTRSDGKTVRLSDYLDPSAKKPVVLSLVYYRCPMLCGLVLNGLNQVMKKSGLDLGTDFTSVTVSIDPKETFKDAESKRLGYLRSHENPIPHEAWGFLVGEDAQIGALAESVGFKYAYDAQ